MCPGDSICPPARIAVYLVNTVHVRKFIWTLLSPSRARAAGVTDLVFTECAPSATAEERGRDRRRPITGDDDDDDVDGAIIENKHVLSRSPPILLGIEAGAGLRTYGSPRVNVCVSKKK